MALDEFLLSLLEDPVDHGKLLYVPSRDVLFNPRTRIAYAIRESIPVMLPDEASAVSDEDVSAYEADPGARWTGGESA